MFLCHTLYLLLGLVLLARAVDVQPSNHSKRAPVQSITILDKMTDTSVNGGCSFPPVTVLRDFKTFDFFEECNRTLPTRFTPHTPIEDILCMGLYEIGNRICNVVSLEAIPTKREFKQFIENPNKKETDAKLCSEFGSLTSIKQVPENESLDIWNIMKIFTKNPQVCSQICFYYNGDSRELCRLILWGNMKLVNVTQLAASNEANQRLAGPKISPAAASKSVEVPTVDYSQGISEIGAERSSSNQQGAPYLQQDLPHLKAPSQDNSENSTPQKLAGNTEGQKLINDGLKHSSVESEGGSTDIVAQGDHPPVPVDSPTNQDELYKASKEKQKSLKPNGGNTNLRKEETTVNDSSKKKLGDLTQEGKLYKQDEKKKVVTPESIYPPAPSPTAIAPKTEEEIVENTASIPSNDADLDPVGAEFMSTADDPIPEGEDDGLSIDNSIAKADDINDEENRESNPSKPIVNPEQTGSIFDSNSFEDSEDSHFFRYFMTMVVICIFGYLLFHNKQKILALFLEGRSRRGTRRRPNTANYHKLDCNLEEAVSSPCSTSVAHVIY